MNRSIVYDEEQVDPFDVLWQFKDIATALGLLQSALAGQTTTVVTGLAATATSPTSLEVNIGAGQIFEQSPIDPTAYGALALDETVVQNQGIYAAAPVTLSTSALTAGQSQWALIQAQFITSDVIRVGDPTSGVLNYINPDNPTQVFQGLGGDGDPQPTERESGVSITIVYGTPATTGSEAPPNPSSGCVPLYLVDLAYGQTTIANNQILAAGPSVGTNVPSDYPYAPFLAGLLNSHHGGTAGQAPKINLGSEVQGVLPAANGGVGGGLIAPLYLKYVGTTSIALVPAGGTAIVINGTFYQIPSAGVSSPLTGVTVGGVASQNLAANTVYDVFVYSNAGTVTFDFWNASTPAQHMTDTTAGNVGVEVRNANPTGSATPDSTRTYVGKIATNAVPNFQLQSVGVISWFNRKNQAISVANASAFTATTDVLTELTSTLRCTFLTFGDETVRFDAWSGNFYSDNVGNSAYFNIGIDGATVAVAPFGGSTTLTTGQGGSVSGELVLAEGQHYSTIIAANALSGHTGTYAKLTNIVTLRG
jgi:hypothetical protein